jgi:signal transduction histidine kinase
VLVAALGALWIAVVATVGIVDSASAAALTGGLLLAVATTTLLAARLARRRGRGSLDRQFMLGVSLPVVQMLLVAVLFAAIMFFSTHDAILIVLVTSFAGLLGLVTARVALGRLVSDVRAISEGLSEVGSGRRDVTIEAEGSQELSDLARAANRMTERVEAEERARRNLMAAISHDLRTPMTSLQLVAEALSDEILTDEERRRYAARMTVNVAALNGLIEDLFELSRLEAGETAWVTERVGLQMLVGETVDAIQAAADSKRITIESDVPEDLMPARANPEKLQRVLFNLLTNAIRHTPVGGKVAVRATMRSEHVEVEVADTGEGIPPNERDTIFDAFVQGAARAARSDAGAGLGLAISRAIVQAHGGRIWLEDAARGTRIRFSLPAATA